MIYPPTTGPRVGPNTIPIPNSQKNLCALVPREPGLGLDYWCLVGLWCGGLGQVLAGGKSLVRDELGVGSSELGVRSSEFGVKSALLGFLE